MNLVTYMDVNGVELARGDLVELSDAMKLDDPQNNYGLGVGEIFHIFSTGIHVRFKDGIRVANNGRALRKVTN